MSRIWRCQSSGRVSSADLLRKRPYGQSQLVVADAFGLSTASIVEVVVTTSIETCDVIYSPRVTALNESITINGESVYVNGSSAPIEASVDELATATESSSVNTLSAGSIAESAILSELSSGLVRSSLVVAESLSAIDTISLSQIHDTLATEMVEAVGEAAATATDGGAVSESVSSGSVESSLSAYGVAQIDAATAVSDGLATTSGSGAVVEPTGAADVVLSWTEWNTALAEVALASDSAWCVRIIDTVTAESTVAFDRVLLLQPIYPLPSQVSAGVYYGPHGDDYLGTLDSPSASQLSTAVIDCLAYRMIPVDVKQINGVTIIGSGVSGDSMRPGETASVTPWVDSEAAAEIANVIVTAMEQIQIAVNVAKVNGVPITGHGIAGDPMRPA